MEKDATETLEASPEEKYAARLARIATVATKKVVVPAEMASTSMPEGSSEAR